MAADELIGHHLAEALAHLVAVGGDGDHVRTLALRAGELLVRAAFRAEERDDVAAAVALLDRGVALLPGSSRATPRTLPTGQATRLSDAVRRRRPGAD